jgi:hypothetical protein
MNLDKIVQGSINRYIVNNIYNDSLVINGTLTVRDINIIDLDSDYYSNIYNSNLHSCSEHEPSYSGLTDTNVSNIVYGILGDRMVTYEVTIQNTSNFIFQELAPLEQNISNINSNLSILRNEIDNVKDSLGRVNLDDVIQGTSNKYITNNLYNDSLFINGTLTVRNINIIDIDTPDIAYNINTGSSSTSYVNSTNVSNIVMDFLFQKDYETKINDSYELLSYALTTETSLLSNRLNLQANEISKLKNDIIVLTSNVAYLMSQI